MSGGNQIALFCCCQILPMVYKKMIKRDPQFFVLFCFAFNAMCLTHYYSYWQNTFKELALLVNMINTFRSFSKMHAEVLSYLDGFLLIITRPVDFLPSNISLENGPVSLLSMLYRNDFIKDNYRNRQEKWKVGQWF